MHHLTVRTNMDILAPKIGALPMSHRGLNSDFLEDICKSCNFGTIAVSSIGAQTRYVSIDETVFTCEKVSLLFGIQQPAVVYRTTTILFLSERSQGLFYVTKCVQCFPPVIFILSFLPLRYSYLGLCNVE
jgi:hypothetical protein